MTAKTNQNAFDIVIIGAGVVGCSIARELSKYKLNVCLLEKNAEASFGVSKANSGIVHAGFHSPPDMLKSVLCVRGNELYGTLQEELDIPFTRNGELMIAKGEEEEKKLDFFLEQGKKLGVPDLEIVRGQRLKELEPKISDSVTAALYAPTAGVTNPYEFTYRLLQNACANGVVFHTDEEVISLEQNKVVTTKETYHTKFILNCAGLYADRVAEMAGVSNFKITPRKGEEYLLDKKCASFVNHVIFPLPNEKSKGILIIPTLDGTIMIGPTAEDTSDKEQLNTTNTAFDAIMANTKSIIPELLPKYLISSFAGARPVATGDDFIISTTPLKGFVNVAGIQSPGLTAAPAIAEYVVDLLKDEGLLLDVNPSFNPRVEKHVKIKDLDSNALNEMIKQNPLYGKIVCRCERISEAEIRQAVLEGARTLDGIKFRTRAGMGRCQGGFCTFRILEIMSEMLGCDPLTLTKKGQGSELLVKDIKK